MIILAIESSCDDTSAAVLRDNVILSNVLTSQDDIHSQFGGVVPELASRNHLQAINPVVTAALQSAEIKLSDAELIAVTQGPGLMGSLLVGFSYARAMAEVSKIPLVGVDHMAGHILSAFLDDAPPTFPYIALIVSGGTSSLFLAKSFTRFELIGRTRDDAAGEAFDKVAKLLDLPYPGGPHVSKKAESGKGDAIRFPRAWLDSDSLDFSFSGLKTAVLNHVNKQKRQHEEIHLNDICASFQEAVVDVLTEKTVRAADMFGVTSIVVGGGVAANKRLREKLAGECTARSLSFHVPQPLYCTDNAAMIALAGRYKYLTDGPLPAGQDVYSRSILG